MWRFRLLIIIICGSAIFASGCRFQRAVQAIKDSEIEPKAKKHREEIDKLSGSDKKR